MGMAWVWMLGGLLALLVRDSKPVVREERRVVLTKNGIPDPVYPVIPPPGGRKRDCEPY